MSEYQIDRKQTEITNLLENGVVILDEDLNIILWNKWLEVNTGIMADEAVQNKFDELFVDININLLKRKIKITLELNSCTYYNLVGGKPFIKIPTKKISSFRHYDYMQVEATMQPFDVQRRLVALIIYNQTEIFETHQKLIEINEKLNANLEIIDKYVLILKTDKNGLIIDASRAFCEKSGYAKEELVGQRPNILRSENVSTELYKQLWETILRGKVWQGELQNVRKDKTHYWVYATITPNIDETGQVVGFTGIQQDISEKKEIEEMSITDSLTKAFNRSKFDTRIDEEMYISKRQKTPLSLIIFDIDNFKQVNDTYGHQQGDYVLLEISNLIKKHVRVSDFFARWGGEEFVILLPFTDLDTADKVAQKLRKIISEHNFETLETVTCSFGVTEFKEDEDKKSFIKRVDDALYKAKNNGKNKVIAE